MYHGMRIGDKDTWADWHLVPTERPIIPPPDVKAISADIPGGDGFYDMTETLDGCVHYETRSVSFEFYVMNGYQPFNLLYREILTYLHGRRRTLVLDDDPNYYYTGRFTVSASNGDTWAKITIEGTVDPFKYEHQMIELVFDDVSNSQHIRMPIVNVPTRISIVTDVDCDISYENRKPRSLVAGTIDEHTVLIPEKQTYMQVTNISGGGQATISIRYRGGSL